MTTFLADTAQSVSVPGQAKPCVIFEVGSTSTIPIDHREKLLAYRGSDTLQAYVIVESASQLVIVHHCATDDGSWWRDEHHADGLIELPCPSGFTLTLDQIYAGVLASPGQRPPL